jgi:hypothetical protein
MPIDYLDLKIKGQGPMYGKTFPAKVISPIVTFKACDVEMGELENNEMI